MKEPDRKDIAVSIIVPTYNEEKTIIQILEKVQWQKVEGIHFEVVVVDDGSRDNTVSLLEQNKHLYHKLVRMKKNGGKGAAVKQGLLKASGEYILFQDADLEYDPADYADLMRPIRDFAADVVIGSRLLAPKVARVVYFWHKVGNYIITQLFNIIHNTTFSDIYSCYVAFRKNLVDPNELLTSGWEQQAEILSLAVKRGKVHYETPISYHGRTYDEGKKIRGYHIIPVIWMILRRGLLSPSGGHRPGAD